MEHRWGERLRVEIPARITAHPFSVRPGTIVDLSVSGASIHVNCDVRLLSRIEVALDLPHHTRHDAPILHAYVARKYRHGIGVEWCEFAPAEIARVLRTLAVRKYSHAAKPSPRAATIARLSGALLKHGG